MTSVIRSDPLPVRVVGGVTIRGHKPDLLRLAALAYRYKQVNEFEKKTVLETLVMDDRGNLGKPGWKNRRRAYRLRENKPAKYSAILDTFSNRVYPSVRAVWRDTRIEPATIYLHLRGGVERPRFVAAERNEI